MEDVISTQQIRKRSEWDIASYLCVMLEETVSVSPEEKTDTKVKGNTFIMFRNNTEAPKVLIYYPSPSIIYILSFPFHKGKVDILYGKLTGFLRTISEQETKGKAGNKKFSLCISGNPWKKAWGDLEEKAASLVQGNKQPRILKRRLSYDSKNVAAIQILREKLNYRKCLVL